MNVERGRHNLTLYSRCYEMDTSMMMSYIQCFSLHWLFFTFSRPKICVVLPGLFSFFLYFFRCLVVVLSDFLWLAKEAILILVNVT